MRAQLNFTIEIFFIFFIILLLIGLIVYLNTSFKQRFLYTKQEIETDIGHSLLEFSFNYVCNTHNTTKYIGYYIHKQNEKLCDGSYCFIPKCKFKILKNNKGTIEFINNTVIINE